MIDFRVQIAGRVVAVRAMFENTRTFCENYLCSLEPDFTVETTVEDISFERDKSVREDRAEGKPPRMFSDPYLESIALQRKIAERLFEYDTLLFHGSAVAVDGVGYLFTAKSGTGKSTHTNLWRDLFGEKAVIINDDKPFLTVKKEGIFVWGSPWSGKHGLDSNTCVPLKAICILGRGAENKIWEITAQESLVMLFQQSNRPMRREWMPRYMELIDTLALGVRLYQMECNMDISAAQLSYEEMSKNNSNI